MRKNILLLLNMTVALLAMLALCGLYGCRPPVHTAKAPSAPEPVKVASTQSASPPAANADPGPPLQIDSSNIVDQAPPDPLPAGTKAWDFHTKTIQGRGLTLTSLRGHVTIVDFWATWCGPCQMEIPYLEGVYKQYRGKGVRMVGMSMDTDTAARVPDFVREAHMTYTVAVDPGRNTLACEHYNAGTLPSLFIIDQNGVVRWSAAGYHDGMMDDVKTVLNQLLS